MNANVTLIDLKTDPPKPRWGDSLTVRVETSAAPRAGLHLIAFERRTEGFQTRRIPMVGRGCDWTAQLAVPYLAFEIGLTVAAPGWRHPDEHTIAVVSPEGPAPGTYAWEAVKKPSQWQRFRDLEYELQIANPFAWVIFWNIQLACAAITPEDIREEALEKAGDVHGLSPWGRRAIAYGLALSGDLEYAAGAIEELARRYPGSPAVDQALRDYDVARSRHQALDADPLEALRERLAHKDPSRPIALERVGRWARDPSGRLATVERITLPWTERESDNPIPWHHLAVALLTTQRDPAQAEQASRRALDAALAGWLWIYLDTPAAQDVAAAIHAMRKTRIETALSAGCAADALAHLDALGPDYAPELREAAQRLLGQRSSDLQMGADKGLDDAPVGV